MTTFRLDNELYIRPFEPADAEEIFSVVMENYEHLQTFMVWMSPDYSIDDARDFVAGRDKGGQRPGALRLGIFKKDKLIGSIGLVYVDTQASKTEIGYWIAKSEEGRGIISRACRMLVEHVFHEIGLNRVEIRCAADNYRSSAIPEKLGFTKEGVLRQSEFRNAHLHDFNVFGLLVAEWKNNNGDNTI